MEAELQKYRLRKRRQETIGKFKEKFLKLMSFQEATNNTENNVKLNIPDENKENTNKEPNDINKCSTSLETARKVHFVPTYISSSESESDEENTISNNDDSPISGPKYSWMRYTLWIVSFLFWATCYAIAIELKFGIVFLMISALFGIYFNTRTEPRKEGEISAYSVFNENCLSIDGTLKAEQLEREMLYGPQSVR